jgi:peroxiredoxin
LNYNNWFTTAAIVIEPGTQTITCNIDSSKKMPQVNNRIMNEHKTEFQNAYTEVDKTEAKIKAEWDSLKKVYNNKVPQSAQLSFRQLVKLSYTQGDEALLNCVKQFPDSYIKFWTLVRLSGFGYENIYSDIYQALSPNLKATYTGKVLGKKLNAASVHPAIGKPFPQIKSFTAKQEALQNTLYLKNKFTLVDFWYSNCAPCVAQFDELKNIYKDYRNSGLEIVWVSTDKIKAEQNWKKVIKDRQLSWPQYWDKNGVESCKLAITAFPINFLVDSNGIVVQKNISPPELRQFLEKNISTPAL